MRVYKIKKKKRIPLNVSVNLKSHSDKLIYKWLLSVSTVIDFKLCKYTLAYQRYFFINT